MKKSYLLFRCLGCGSAITESLMQWAGMEYKVKNLEWEERDKWPQQMGSYNPLCQVPTLVLPNKEILTETLATAVHINKIKAGLIPEGKNADHFWRWAVFMIANIYPTFTYRDNAEKFLKSTKARKEFSDNVMDRRKYLWRLVEKECGGTWFLGKEFSALDIYLAIMINWTPGEDWFKKECPKIFKTAKKAQALPFMKKIMEENFNQ